MRTREEVAQLMGAKDREIDDVQETEDGTVVTIRGFRSLIRADGSMVHGVDEPEFEIVGEVSEEDAVRIAAVVGNGEVMAESDPVPDGSIPVVLEWVGQDRARGERALNVELHRDAPRSTLVNQLSQLLATLGFQGE